MLSFQPKYTVIIYRQRNDFDEWLFMFSLLVSISFPLALLANDVHSSAPAAQRIVNPVSLSALCQKPTLCNAGILRGLQAAFYIKYRWLRCHSPKLFCGDVMFILFQANTANDRGERRAGKSHRRQNAERPPCCLSAQQFPGNRRG